MYYKKSKFITWQQRYMNAVEDHKQLIGDKVIRDVLYEFLEELYGDDWECLEEVNFPGFRADMLVFHTGKDKAVFGYEIKSDRDTLSKLERQLNGYLTYCNCVFVVSTYTHKKQLLKILDKPGFEKVGVFFYKMSFEGKSLEVKRPATFSEIKGLSTDFISRASKLYSWELFLKGLWK